MPQTEEHTQTMKRTITGIVIVAVFLAVGFGLLLQRERAFSARWHDQVAQRIQTLDDYASHAANYDRWFETQHDALFAEHYSAFSGFDGEAYLANIFRDTADQAATEGFAEQADKLRQLHGSMLYKVD